VAAVPGLGPSSRVLDVGSGTGCLIPHLRGAGVRQLTVLACFVWCFVRSVQEGSVLPCAWLKTCISSERSMFRAPGLRVTSVYQ